VRPHRESLEPDAAERIKVNVGELRQGVRQISWYHSIDLGKGVVTPGVFRTSDTLRRLRLPRDLSESTVLDVGAWDGFYSFEAERRGARRVLATDWFCWGGPGWGTKEGFDFARRALNSKVEDMEIDVLDLSPDKVGVWDVVLLLGVLYHMRHPLLALERVASVTRRLLILETQIDLIGMKRPALAFYPGAELDNDSTNWFGPNAPAVVGMLRAAGFRKADVVSSFSFPYRLGRALKWRLVGRGDFTTTLQQGRLVVHAWR
jgi:tRNA (mo5U34)-methyltransferase